MYSFVDVVLPLPIKNTFTYLIDKKLFPDVNVGVRVVVPFGKNKIYTGIVVKIHSNKPELYEVKPVMILLDNKSIINELQIDFWSWMSKYYMCSMGDIMRASLPSTLLLESENQFIKKKVDSEKLKGINDEHYLIYEALESGPLSLSDVMDVLQKKSVMSIIEEMLEMDLIELNQKLKDKYVPKMVRYIGLNKKYQTKESQKELFENLKRSTKQLAVIKLFIKNNLKVYDFKKVKDLKILFNVSNSIIKQLIDKKIFVERYFREDRNIIDKKIGDGILSLSEHQKIAFNKILELFKTKNTILLQGVTSSGKTEIYMKLIELEIEKGNQVLYLLPEIALASQILKRLIYHFGKKVSVYHSRYSLNERTEVWRNIMNNKESASIVVGARSAIFLPFNQLGLIVIDEEHESSYKQFEPNPRYNARDCGIYLGSKIGAKVVLGSATPSIESSVNVRKGKFGWVKLKERFGGLELPDIKILDLKECYEKKKMDGVFSHNLIKEIKSTLNKGYQIILFQNRRGYSPILECLSCGFVSQCVQCDVSLTYHQVSNQLRCHYCDYSILKPKQCDSCGMFSLDTKGIGTQQIQEQARKLFPGIEVERMDYDNTRGKYSFDKILESFSFQKIHILVGTQMLIKGLNFKNVQLVGVLNTDHLINFPDFRSYERTFQMLCQVSGRAGRYKEKGKVILQTFQPENELLKNVINYDYDSMFKNQKIEREEYKYPPFFKLIKITFKNKNVNIVNESSEWFSNVLKQNYKGTILGPVFPYISKIRNLFQKQLLLKIDSNLSQIQTKKIIWRVFISFQSIAKFKSTKISFDVDPY